MYFSDTSNLSMNSAKSRFFSILNHIEEVIIVSMFALMVIIIFVQVIMRKAGNSLSWSEELGKFVRMDLLDGHQSRSAGRRAY